MSDAPFAPLTPDFVLSAVESAGFACDGHLLTLNSYENRVYQIGIDDSPPLIAKFYRPERWSDGAILEEHAFLAELAAAEVPAVPAIERQGRSLHRHEGFRFALFQRRGGRAPELDDAAVLTWLGRFLGRIHAIGATRSFSARPDLDIHSFGEVPRDELLLSPFIPPELREPWRSVVEQALQEVRRCFELAGAQPNIRLHGDVHAGNVLWTDAGPHFVDFDDARNGPPIQDLWMLLSGDAPAMARQLDHVLEGYEQFAEFDPSSLYLVEALRTLRLIHYAAWIAKRWHDPAFPVAFSWFDSPRYWQDMILALREQIPLMQEAPLTRQF